MLAKRNGPCWTDTASSNHSLVVKLCRCRSPFCTSTSNSKLPSANVVPVASERGVRGGAMVHREATTFVPGDVSGASDGFAPRFVHDRCATRRSSWSTRRPGSRAWGRPSQQSTPATRRQLAACLRVDTTPLSAARQLSGYGSCHRSPGRGSLVKAFVRRGSRCRATPRRRSACGCLGCPRPRRRACPSARGSCRGRGP